MFLQVDGRVTPYAGVWIEIAFECNINRTARVTPYAGVWIEIEKEIVITESDLFHSLRGSVDWNRFPSVKFPLLSVTPYAGVWIEMKNMLQRTIKYTVTPYAGVWIEILRYVMPTHRW